MDNFMDKLSKRFNAGEMIQANGEAEARENDRLKKQTEEYDKILQEVRRLNLKTVEISEQVAQMAAASIEQIESYNTNLVLPDSDNEDVLGELSVIKDQISDLKNLTQNIKYEKPQTDEIGNDEVVNSIRQQIDLSSSQIKREVSDTSYRLEASISQIEDEISQNRRSIDSSVQVIKAEIAKQQEDSGNEEAVLASIEKLLDEQTKAQEENAKQIKEMIASLRIYVEEVQKHIEDYVHKEDVKVYRNVQAVITQQFSDRARELSTRMDQMQSSGKKSTGAGTTFLVVLAVLLSGGSLAIQVLQMLGIL